MFSFRRKPKQEPASPRIRTSPSLPELNSQGIPWPEDLVDIAAIREEQQPRHTDEEEEDPTSPSSTTHTNNASSNTNGAHSPHHSKGAAKIKTSFQSDKVPIPFHKPFRPSIGAGKGQEGLAAGGGPGAISALYMSGPPATFDKHVLPPSSAGRYSQRRARIPPTFNLMVVGGKGTGKTSLLRLLLETADTSPGATIDQKAAVDQFLKGSTKATQAIQTACVEICESRFDRVLFSVIDTPGLDFMEGRELKLERQVSTVLKYVDAQYADTMSEESKVVRQSKGDQHIHLCIYMIDPDSIMTASARGASSTLPTKTRSETTVSPRTPPELVADTSSDDDDESEDEEEVALTMSPAEIRVIRRLTARTNVLPVIARADSLTDDKLAAVKNAVRLGLGEANIDFGVFGPTKKPEAKATRQRQTHFATPNGETNGNGHVDDAIPEEAESDGDGEEEEEDEEERQPRPVIKLRSNRHHRALSRSRSRRDLSQAAADDRRPVSPDVTDKESIANVRFSAHIVAKTDLSSLLPFALIAPEPTKRRLRPVSAASSAVALPPNANANAASPQSQQQPSEDGHEGVPPTPASVSGRNYTFLNGPPEDLKGVFVRKFRWGTVDVLDPNHCDFAALRTAVLSTHVKLLKIRTKEVLYEKYRTEKLLARRATSHITDEERERLLEELGL